MKLTKLILAVMLLIVPGIQQLQAQEAVVAAGGDGSGSGGSISYSVGQIGTTTNTGTNGYSAAEGVQQPYEISVVTGIEEDTGFKLECLVYPNPTMDHLTLRIDDTDSEELSYQLYDLQANLLEDEKLSSKETIISMEKLVPAIYFLKITDNQKEVKIFKIVKN